MPIRRTEADEERPRLDDEDRRAMAAKLRHRGAEDDRLGRVVDNGHGGVTVEPAAPGADVSGLLAQAERLLAREPVECYLWQLPTRTGSGRSRYQLNGREWRPVELYEALGADPNSRVVIEEDGRITVVKTYSRRNRR